MSPGLLGFGSAPNETEDYIAVVRLQAAYGDTVTRRDWEEMAALFEPDAVITVDTGRGEPIEATGGPAIGEFIARSIERFEFFEFVPLNTVVNIDSEGGYAVARLYIQELRQEAATGRFTTAYGLYRDRYRRRDGVWRFAARRYRSLARTATKGDRDLEVLPPPTD